MYDVFYIVEVGENWYHLHIKDTHYCLGATHDLEALKRTIKRLVKKYRTKERLMRGLAQMEDKGKVNENMTKIYAELYAGLHHYYDEVVKITVKEALEEVKQDSTFNRVKKRLKTVTHEVLTTTHEPEIEVKLVMKRPKILKKGKCLSI